MPHPGGPPVEGRAVMFGFACHHEGCLRVLVNKRKMAEHQSHDHPGEVSNYQSAAVQHLFNLPVRYFSVNALLGEDNAAEEDDDLMLHLIHSVIPDATEPRPILTASDDRGRSQLEQHFRFDDLLLPVRKSRRSLLLLADLKQKYHEAEDGGIYEKLFTTMTRWHVGVCHNLSGKTNQIDLQRCMLYGPNIPPDE